MHSFVGLNSPLCGGAELCVGVGGSLGGDSVDSLFLNWYFYYSFRPGPSLPCTVLGGATVERCAAEVHGHWCVLVWLLLRPWWVFVFSILLVGHERVTLVVDPVVAIEACRHLWDPV